jgi:mannose-6-phosphate isomerase-like protein (cupin superfamily)
MQIEESGLITVYKSALAGIFSESAAPAKSWWIASQGRPATALDGHTTAHPSFGDVSLACASVKDMARPPVTAEEYAAEPVRFPALRIVDLAAEAAAVDETYRNMVLLRVNSSCLRLAVLKEVFAWHYHPTSDEVFVVLEGCLAIDLVDGRELRLGPLEAVTVPAGTVHRTRAMGRTVNLCFEKMAADTIFVEGPESRP